MVDVVADRVVETSTTTGTGALTLAGAVAGFRTFGAVCTVGDTLLYCIEAVDGDGLPTGEWEVGLGTYSGANTLTRTDVHASSNAGAAVNLSAGTKRVSLTLTAYQVAGLTFSRTVVESGTSANLDPALAGAYHRWTNVSAKTLTVQEEATEPLPADGEWHVRNVGSNNLTIVADGGVTINTPVGGSLVVAPGGTVTLKRVAEDEFDLVGATVAP